MKKIRFLVTIFFLLAAFLIPAGISSAADDKPDVKPMVGKFSKIEGTVEVQKFGTQEWVQAKEGMEIGSGDQVASGVDGKAQIAFANSKTDVEPLAQFSVGRNYETKDQFFSEVFLQVGKIKSDVDKKSGKANKFTVTTPSSVAGIRGTVLECAYTPGVGAVNTISEGAGYVAPVQADKLPPAIQQILNIPPSAEVREAAAKAAEKAGASASVVAQIAAGAAPTEEARAVMSDIAIAGGASPEAAAAIEQGFGSFAAIASSLTIPEVPVVGADVAPIAPAPGAPAPAVGAPVGDAAGPGAAPEAAKPAVKGMEAMVAASAAGAVPGVGGVPAAAGVGPAGGPAGNPMQGMAALLATVPGLVAAAGPGAPFGGAPAGVPQQPVVGAPIPGVTAGPAGSPIGAPGVPGAPIPGGPVGGGPGVPAIAGPAGGPIGGPFDFARAFGPVSSLGNGQSGFSAENNGRQGPNVVPIIPLVLGPIGLGPGGPGPLGQIGPLSPIGPAPGGGLIGPGPLVDPNVLSGNMLDRDHDGMPNDWELANGLNPDDPSDASRDADKDGYPNILEFGAGTNPKSATSFPTLQTVGGVASVNIAGQGFIPVTNIVSSFLTQNLNLDPNGNGLLFNPSTLDPDIDKDGMYDDWERANGLNPASALDASGDLDGDGYTNLQEFTGHSSPTSSYSVPYASSVTFVDNDGDGMPNDWEIAHGLNSNFPDANQDFDHDGVININEFFGGSDPQSASSTPGAASSDADGDGMPTSWEIAFGFNPNSNDASSDYDNDGYTNLQEFQIGTDPKNSSSNPATSGASTSGDADHDGLPDNWEISNGFSPSNAADASTDFDVDGYSNLQEFQSGSNPLLATSTPGTVTIVDVDMDGLPDNWEIANGFNPNSSVDGSMTVNPTTDPDGDGYTNKQEFQNGTDPHSAASNPGSVTVADADHDEMPDNWEVANGFNPNNAADAAGDFDNDGYKNVSEFIDGSDPKSANSKPNKPESDLDGDGMNDAWERKYGLNPNNDADGLMTANGLTDPDGDGFTNKDEYNAGSNPRRSGPEPSKTLTQRPTNASTDADMDMLPDIWEDANGLSSSSASDASSDADADGFSAIEEYFNHTDPRNKWSQPARSHGLIVTGMGNQYDATLGVRYDQHTDGFRTYFNPDRAGSVTGGNGGPPWTLTTAFQMTAYAGPGYVNVGGTVPMTGGSWPGGGQTIQDGDGDGHSPQAAFQGTVFYDPNDGNFNTPLPQSMVSESTSTDPDHHTWSNNPNPFHH